MISAVTSAYSATTVWDSLKIVADGSGGYGFVALIIMVVFLILALMLLIYYVLRIVTLYIGAVLAPLIVLLQIMPGFKDFSLTAIKAYITNIFVLFIHVIILTLAATLFEGVKIKDGTTPFNPIMAMIIGVATLLALLRTQSVLMQMTYVSAGPRSLRKLSSQFMNGVSYTTSKMQNARSSRTSAAETATSRGNTSAASTKPKTHTKEGYK